MENYIIFTKNKHRRHFMVEKVFIDLMAVLGKTWHGEGMAFLNNSVMGTASIFNKGCAERSGGLYGG
jgi:hypothetical protein